MTLNRPLFAILYIFCFGYLHAQEAPIILVANDPEQSFKVIPDELITTALHKHKSQDTLLLVNQSIEQISWYSQQSYAWLYLSSAQGTLKAGEAFKLPIELQVESLPQAIYSDTLYFKNSKTYEILATVPIEVMIEAKPRISVPVSHFSPTLLANGYKKINFTVANEGNTDLDYSIYTDVSVAWLQTLLPTQGILAPGESKEHSLIVNGSGIENGSYQGSAWISSNDPNQPRTFIEVDLTLSTEKAALLSDINKAGLCQDEKFEIPYQFKGVVLGKANKIIAELSDSYGRFDKAIRIGEKRNQDTIGTIPVHIPENLKAGNSYKIRLVSTDPQLKSIDAGKAFSMGPKLNLTFDKIASVCDTEDDFLLNHAAPEGGSYSGIGVLAENFSPRLAGAGKHTIRYNYITEQGCNREISQEIWVRESPKITHLEVDSICQGSQAFKLQGGKPKGGFYEGPAVKPDGLLVPANLRVGEHKLRYIVEETECRSEVEVPISIVPSPSKPEFTQSGRHLIAKEDYYHYTWSYNGKSLPNAHQRMLTPKAYGSYTLWIKNEQGCQTSSDPLNFEAPDISETIWESLKISPNPAINHLYISGEIKGSEHPSTINMVFKNDKGLSMIEASYANIKGRFTRRINWSGLKPGVYQLSLEWEGKKHQQDIVITEK